MGNNQDSASCDAHPLSLGESQNREPRERICLRKGCGNRYTPQRWNQRYCQDPLCRLEVRRWLAAKRQRRQRVTPEGRQRHRQRERQRRERQRRERQQQSAAVEPDKCTPDPKPAGAWSRRSTIPEDFCDRPGCYEATRNSPRVAAKYCSDQCRQAVAKVRDRERKWLMRNAIAQTKKPVSRHPLQRTKTTSASDSSRRRNSSQSKNPFVNYRSRQRLRLSCRAHERSEVNDHQRDSCPQPRPPPAS